MGKAMRPWADPKAPTRDASVFRHQLEHHARERPDQIFVRFEDGPTWTFAQALEIARKSASGLKKLGVKFGDPVFIWMPTQPEFIEIMFGVHYLGGVVASPNTAYKGGVLQHLIKLTGAKVAAGRTHPASHLHRKWRSPLQACGGLRAGLRAGCGRASRSSGLRHRRGR